MHSVFSPGWLRCFLPLASLLLSLPAFSQKFVLGNQEFMDTTTARPGACPAGTRARYYSVDGKYPRSSATLAHEAQAFLRRTSRAYAGSGYVTFRFIVDCQGHRQPKTEVLQTTPTYQPCHLPPELVAALYAYLQTLTEWKVAKADSPLNYVAYLTFKLTDGSVVAVVP